MPPKICRDPKTGRFVKQEAKIPSHCRNPNNKRFQKMEKSKKK